MRLMQFEKHLKRRTSRVSVNTRSAYDAHCTNYVNIFADITANALRRFFIQKAQTLADDSKVASIAGHHPNSAVQYTKYGSTFSTLDIVKMIQYSKFEDMKEANKFMEGVRCPQQLFKRMTKQEYEKEVAPFIEQEKKDLEAVVASMKESYGTKYKTSIESWSVLDTKKYKMACRRYKNARDRYRRKGLKKLPEERQKKALKEMKVDENEAVVTDDIEEGKQNNKF